MTSLARTFACSPTPRPMPVWPPCLGEGRQLPARQASSITGSASYSQRAPGQSRSPAHKMGGPPQAAILTEPQGAKKWAARDPAHLGRRPETHSTQHIPDLGIPSPPCARSRLGGRSVAGSTPSARGTAPAGPLRARPAGARSRRVRPTPPRADNPRRRRARSLPGTRAEPEVAKRGGAGRGGRLAPGPRRRPGTQAQRGGGAGGGRSGGQGGGGERRGRRVEWRRAAELSGAAFRRSAARDSRLPPEVEDWRILNFAKIKYWCKILLSLSL